MMYKFVYLLLFCSISTGICEHANVFVDINYIENRRAVACKSRNSQEYLIDGEEIQLVATLPSNIGIVAFMWCNDNNGSEVVSRCKQTAADCISLNLTKFTSRQREWKCIYHIESNTKLQPRAKHQGKEYTSPTCEVKFTALEKVWFTGLDPNRRTVAQMADGSGFKFVYKYEKGEQLNITCQSNAEFEIDRTELKNEWDMNLSTYSNQEPFVREANDSLDETKLYCYSRTRKQPLARLELKSRIPVIHKQTWNPITPSTRFPPTPRYTTETTKAPVSDKAELKIQGIKAISPKKFSNVTHNIKTYTSSFSEPEKKSIECIFNSNRYVVKLTDGNQLVHNGSATSKSKPIILPYEFTLNSNKTLICEATQRTQTNPRIFQVIVHWIYVPKKYETPATVSTTKDPDTTTESGISGAGGLGLVTSVWPIVAICCTIVILIICIVTCLVKMMCNRKKTQPPEDHVNLTSDRGNDYPSQTIPNRTVPIIQSNYCDPKDIKGLKSSIEPNYSEAREPQSTGEGLYAELNRPEDTYAEPYINKNELYAQPIPKAQRRKKDDPNYGNVFGQDYVNSRK